MPVDSMFWLATASFAWGFSLATYRWFALYNEWPMGEWQAHRPGLVTAIGAFAVLFALMFAVARGGGTLLVVPLLGLLLALVWTALTRVGAQSALLLAPGAMIGLLLLWMALARNIDYDPTQVRIYSDQARQPGAAGQPPAPRFPAAGDSRTR